MTREQALIQLGESTVLAIAGVLDTLAPDSVERGEVSIVPEGSAPLATLPLPAVAASVAYVDGVTGGNVFVFTHLGAKRLAAAMMGAEPEDLEGDELSELELSAVGEATNQMMAAAAAGTGAALGTEVSISTPTTTFLTTPEDAAALFDGEGHVTSASFTVHGEPCRLVQLVPNAFVIKMTRALDEIAAERRRATDRPRARVAAESLRGVPVPGPRRARTDAAAHRAGRQPRARHRRRARQGSRRSRRPVRQRPPVRPRLPRPGGRGLGGRGARDLLHRRAPGRGRRTRSTSEAPRPSAAARAVDDAGVPMKRFSFRLESVRALREQAEEQAKAELGRELALEAALRGLVHDAEARLRQAAVSGSGNGFDFVARQAYIERCERELVGARYALAQGGMRVAQRRAELAQAARERETLERLKNRHADEHAAEGRRAEEAVLSEVGLSMFRSRTA